VTDRLLDRLDAAKRRRPAARGTAALLRRLRRTPFSDAESLVRLHDALLFLRAYPHSSEVLRLADERLAEFGRRVARLAASGADMSAFDHPEVSGIAGTSITTDYSWDVVQWLKRRFGKRLAIDWSLHEATDRLRASLPDFLPLLEEEALEDANVPYLEYLHSASGRRWDDLEWLSRRTERLPLSPPRKAERYDALGLSVSWALGDGRVTRTRMRFPARRISFHDEPLRRHGVSIEEELASPPFVVRRLSRRRAEAVVEMTREATALRYREYYGFTFADPGWVAAADAGRGVEIFLMGLERARRLPLRAGFAGFFVKNGVPIGYIEALAFLERVEIGFNIYYAFREGESAWIFARVVKLLSQVLGVRSFSIDPYQLGHENEEAIKSGAFWFYRKLRFRSTDPALRALTSREERRIASDPEYRSSASVLRRLASRNLLYEISSPARSSNPDSGIQNPESPWDRFHIRNFGLAVIRRMAREFGGDAEEIRRASERRVAASLDLPIPRAESLERRVFSDLALVLDLIPDLSRWPRTDREAVGVIVRAKSGGSEMRYLRLLRRHERLRRALLRLGSAT
jgi:hypothetical protein